MIGQRDQGFTLLEVMLVTVLIGIAATFVVINLERDPDQIAEQEARRFMALLEHVRNETVLTGRTIGVEVSPDEGGYRFWSALNGWAEITDDDVLRPRFVPDYLSIQVTIEPGDEFIVEPVVVNEEDEDDEADEDGDDSAKEEPKSYIIVNTLGEISPFAFSVRGEDYDYVVTLIDGQNLTLEQRDRGFS